MTELVYDEKCRQYFKEVTTGPIRKCLMSVLAPKHCNRSRLGMRRAEHVHLSSPFLHITSFISWNDAEL